MSVPFLKRWKNTVYCDQCNSSWKFMHPDVYNAKECPVCKREQDLADLAKHTVDAIIKRLDTPQAILEAYVEVYLVNRKAHLAYQN
jgi:glutaredoxin